jgi:hypothetical protein
MQFNFGFCRSCIAHSSQKESCSSASKTESATTSAGGRDHSGLLHTGLMPRWLASLVLRHSKRPPHRNELNARRQYRTST